MDGQEFVVKVEDGRISLSGISVPSEQIDELKLVDGPLPRVRGFAAGDGWGRLPKSEIEETQFIMGAPSVSTPLDLALASPLQNHASIEFYLRLKRGYFDGELDEPGMHAILQIPGVGKLFCGLPDDRVSALLVWEWDKKNVPSGNGILVVIPEIPGPEWYHMLLTWDSENGLCSLYMNGTPVRIADIPAPGWQLPPWSTMQLFPAHFDYAQLSVSSVFIPFNHAPDSVPASVIGKRSELFGVRPEPPKLDIDRLRGELIYESSLANDEDLEGWVLDAGKISFNDGWMKMDSEFPDSRDVNVGHMTYWSDKEFPDSFIAEWNVRVLADHIVIVFFAAKGDNGEDFLGPGFPERHGEFIHYIKGRIKSYHISYQSSGGRGISNLRKNNRFYLLTTGTAGIGPNDRSVHRICLVKMKNHIQFHVDGQVIIDYVDNDARRYGAAHGGGRIGLRQMRGGIVEYQSFKVWTIN